MPTSRTLSARILRTAATLVAAAVVSALPLGAGGNPSNLDFKPAGSSDGTANGDYISSTGGLNTFYRYFIEVPTGTSRLVVDIFDPDVNQGGATEEAADRDTNDSTTTSAAYRLFSPSGTAQTTKFGLGSSSLPAGGDNNWITLYDSDSAGAFTAPAFANAGTPATKPSNTTTTLSVPLPAGISAGDFLLLAVARGEGSPPVIATPGGWTLIQEFQGNDGASTSVRIGTFYRIATGTETSPVVVTLGDDREAAGIITRYTGVDSTNPVNVSGTNAAQNNAPTAPSVTTTVANTRVIRIAGVGDDGRAMTVPGGTTQRFNFDQVGGAGQGVTLGGSDQVVAAAGATGTGVFSINASEHWGAITIALRGNQAAVTPTAGHWELQMDMSSAVTATGAENAYSIRAHDGNTGAGGTELNVYYDSHTEYGLVGTGSSPTKSYDVYPYMTSGCTAFENDFDYDVGNGTGGGSAGQEFGRVELWTRSNNGSSSAGNRQQDIQSSQLSGGNAWNRDTITRWTTDNASTEYGIWHSIVRISTQNGGGGNLANVWFADFESGSATPAANPTPNAYRVYLPRDGGGAPAKPYVEQVLGHHSGPNPPVNGQTSTVTVTVRLVNPTPNAITFSGTTTADNIVVASLPGDARVTYVGSSAFPTCGSVASQPAGGATAGNILWNPGTVAAGATCIVSYDVAVTPTAANQRIAVTPVPNIDANFAAAAGTRARFRDGTGNTTQARSLFVFGPLCELAVTSNTATRAMVTGFRTEDTKFGRVVEWRTATEEGTSGWYLYRTDTAGRWVRVLEEEIPADPTAVGGAVYRVVDPAPRSATRYALLEIEGSGAVSIEGTFDVDQQSEIPDLRGGQPTMEAVGDLFADGWSRQAFAATPRRAPSTRARSTSRMASRPAPVSALRVHVLEPGLYRLGADEIALALGLESKAIRGRIGNGGLSLVHRGRSVAWIAAADSGALYFVAAGPADELEADSVYRLELARGHGASTALTAPVKSGADTTFIDRVRTEQDHDFVLAYPIEPADGFWFWNYLRTGEQGHETLTFPLDAPDADPTAPSTIDIDLFGFSSTGVKNEHEVEAWVNGSYVGTAFWTGVARHSESFTVPSGTLLTLANQIELRGYAGNGATDSSVYVDGFDLTYRRRHLAAQDRLLFSADGPTRIGGFSGPDVVLLDITDEGNPVQLVGASISPLPDATWQLAWLANGSAGHRFLATRLSAALMPDSIERASPLNLRSESGAEYLVVAPEALADAAASVAETRRDQGLSARVVTAERIYDEFGAGTADARAFGNFLAWAYANWDPQPRWVLLLGNGSFDLRNRLALGGNLLPPYLVAAPGGIVAADSRLGDVDGDGVPEIAIGRVPAFDSAEVEGFLTKLQANEAAGAAPWTGRAFLLADDAKSPSEADFALDMDRIEPRLSPLLEVQRIDLSGTTDPLARGALLAALDSGVGNVTYVGHGGLTRLADEGLLTVDDVPALENFGRAPVLSALTCSINRYEVRVFPSLGAELVRSPIGGAIAVWSPAAWSRGSEARRLGEALADVTNREPEARLGDVLLAAQRRYVELGGDPEFSSLYLLLGDPATRIATPEPILPPPTPGGGN